MVEGHARCFPSSLYVTLLRPCPSTTFGGPPPRAGKDRPQPAETGNPLQHEEAGGLVPRPPPRHISSMPLPAPFTDWFAARGWRLRRHQADMLAAGERGEHALLVAATGAGRSEERRVGKGGVSTGGSRWAPYL